MTDEQLTSYPELRDSIEAARTVRTNAYAPYSGFRVGAAIVAEGSSRVFVGANVENASYGATVCAERSAVLGMIAAIGKHRIRSVVVVAHEAVPPCALCLQVLSEFSGPDTVVALADEGALRRVFRFDELLPHPFREIPARETAVHETPEGGMPGDGHPEDGPPDIG